MLSKGLVSCLVLSLFLGLGVAKADHAPIPVILDTDIGDDIDDSWALALLLKSPELDLKLALGEFGKPVYRAKLLAQLLAKAGRTDVPVGLALSTPGEDPQANGPEGDLLKNFDLKSYPGTVKTDGVRALIDIIMTSPIPVTIICIGPPVNIAAALQKQPEIAQRAKFIGMMGNIAGKSADPEYNASRSIASTQAALSAAWIATTITPINTCGLIFESGDTYQAVLHSDDPLVKGVLAGYQAWTNFFHHPDKVQSQSSPLYDTLAVYLAFADADVKLEPMSITVDDQGRTLIDPKGKMMMVTTDWKSLDGFEKMLAKRLTAAK